MLAGHRTHPGSYRLSDWADCLAAFIAALSLGRANVAGLSWGGSLALELYRRHPLVVHTLVLVSAYAGWAGSLPADVVEERLQLYLRNSELPPEEWVPAVIETLLTDGATQDMVEELTSILSAFHPAATRIAIRAMANSDLREVLPHVDVPTLLLYGDQDVRSPQHVWAEAITAGHNYIFATIYAGSTNRIELVDAHRISDNVIVSTSRNTLDAPHGPLAGVHQAMSTTVLVRDGADWRIAVTHNTLVGAR